MVNNIEKFQGCERCKMSEEVEKQRANVYKEYAETVSGTGIYQQRCKYSPKEAQERVRACYCFRCSWNVLISHREVGHHDQKIYDIFDLCRTLCKRDGKNFMAQASHLMSLYVHFQILFSLKNILVMDLDLHN